MLTEQARKKLQEANLSTVRALGLLALYNQNPEEGIDGALEQALAVPYNEEHRDPFKEMALFIKSNKEVFGVKK